VHPPASRIEEAGQRWRGGTGRCGLVYPTGSPGSGRQLPASAGFPVLT